MSAKSSASIALFVALGGSLLFHAAALFVPELDLTAADEPLTLQAELRTPPPPPPPVAPPEKKVAPEQPPPPKLSPKHPPKPAPITSPESAVVAPVASAAKTVSSAATGTAPATPAPAVPPKPAEPPLPATGTIRYSVYKGLQGLEVGRAVHTWEFAEDRYRITVMTETSGLAAFFKPIRMDYESRGKIIATGLQPERFTSRKNGAEGGENADFDWSSGQVLISRDGRSYPLSEGAQDFASFYYQLVFLPQLSDGTSMGVATPRKFERYRFEILGEENIETPVGFFRTLHVRVQTDSTIELWLAIERQRLPIKIRYTDKKGDAFEQVAVELGSAKTP